MSKISNEESNSDFWNWGTGLAVVIIFFVAATLGVVGYLTSLEYHLVSDNHYEMAVRYQQHIDRVAHTTALEGNIEIDSRPGSGNIRISFPDTLLSWQPAGSVTLYRPSDSNLDRTFELSLDDDGNQYIPAGELTRGKWLVRISWQIGEKGFFKEAAIFL